MNLYGHMLLAAGRLLSAGFIYLLLFSIPLQAQETEFVDRALARNEAYAPPTFGLLLYGGLPNLYAYEDNERYTSLLTPFRAGVLVYYDAWQVSLDMRPEASYVRVMPRTVGQDAYAAVVLEVGYASKTTPKEINEIRTGVGLSMRSGESERLGLRFLADATVGLAIDPAGIQEAVRNMYVGLHLGAMVRMPVGPMALSAGPYGELGFGYAILSYSGTYVRAGIHAEVALNLHRRDIPVGGQ